MASPPTTPSSQAKTGPRNAPTIINIPPHPSYPDTPEPGTPTSTTTSLSALSTVAIKDGHRGHGFQAHRGHTQQNSTNSLDAERADRISRLAGLERISTLRAPALQVHHPSNPNSSPNSQPTPAATTTTGFHPSHPHTQPHHQNTPISNPPNAFFDANGQPTVQNKMSTVGTASATASVGGRTFTASSDGGEGTLPDRDEDILSMDTNLRSFGNGSEAMDAEDMRSRGGFDDRMSDDGNASLVGFGEGANSTVSGPIYQRRPIPPGGMSWGLERSSSALSEAAMLTRRDRERERDLGAEAPMSMLARDGRMAAMDGMSFDPHDEDGYYETSNGDTVQSTPTTRPNYPGNPTTRETAERIVRERLDQGESRSSPGPAMTSPGPAQHLGHFYFEDRK